MIGGVLGAILTFGFDVFKLHHGEEFEQYMAVKSSTRDVLRQTKDTVAGNEEALAQFNRFASFEDSPRAAAFLSNVTGALFRKLADQKVAVAAELALKQAEADEKAKKKAAADAKALADAAEAAKKAQAVLAAQAAEQAAIQARQLVEQQQRDAEAARQREIESAKRFDRMLQSPRAR